MITESLLPSIIAKMKAKVLKPKVPLLSEMITDFLTKHGATLSPKTVRYYRQGLQKLYEWQGDCPLDEITASGLEQYKTTFASTPRAVIRHSKRYTPSSREPYDWDTLVGIPLKGSGSSERTLQARVC
jgi:hypothetical protein